MPEQSDTDYIETDHGVAYTDAWIWETEDGTAIDLTGKAFTCHCRSGTPDAPGSVVVTISTANGKLATTPLTGTITMTLSAADMQTLAVGDYCFELLDVTGGSPVEVVSAGYWSHRPTGVGTGS